MQHHHRRPGAENVIGDLHAPWPSRRDPHGLILPSEAVAVAQSFGRARSRGSEPIHKEYAGR
jgi:hypothetical protein